MLDIKTIHQTATNSKNPSTHTFPTAPTISYHHLDSLLTLKAIKNNQPVKTNRIWLIKAIIKIGYQPKEKVR